jgi:hypothetical protein
LIVHPFNIDFLYLSSVHTSVSLGLLMRIALLALCLACTGQLVAAEPVDLNALGLGGLEPLSERTGNQIRGASSSAYSTGLSSFMAVIFDPETGSQINLVSNNFARSTDQNAGLNSRSTAAAETSVGFSPFEIIIGNFSASFSEGLFFGAGQAAGSSGFVENFTRP